MLEDMGGSPLTLLQIIIWAMDLVGGENAFGNNDGILYIKYCPGASGKVYVTEAVGMRQIDQLWEQAWWKSSYSD